MIVRFGTKGGEKMLAAKLKELRLKKGISQETLAENLNTSRSNISKYESGKLEPNLFTLKKICKFYNISADELLEIKLDDEEMI